MDKQISDENPYSQPPIIDTTIGPPLNDPTYNIVSDMVVGVNVRKRDNLFQALFIAGSILLGGLIGGVLAWLNPSWNAPWIAAAILGAFLGMIVGLFASGIVLMIYRGVAHLRGRHH
jgi:MFS family permease